MALKHFLNIFRIKKRFRIMINLNVLTLLRDIPPFGTKQRMYCCLTRSAQFSRVRFKLRITLITICCERDYPRTSKLRVVIRRNDHRLFSKSPDRRYLSSISIIVIQWFKSFLGRDYVFVYSIGTFTKKTRFFDLSWNGVKEMWYNETEARLQRHSRLGLMWTTYLLTRL